MIERIIRWCGHNPAVTVIVTAALLFGALIGMRNVPLDALPDLSDTQVIVFAEWQGRSPDLIETQITYPLVTRFLSVPHVKYVRGYSMPGATQIVIVFDEGTDLYFARARVSERLASGMSLPEGVQPTLGPEATSIGWVYQYALVDRSGKHDLAQLRSIQDWNLRFSLQSVPGVAEVAAIGGFVKQYQIDINPLKLQYLGISPLQVVKAIRNANHESSGAALEVGGTSFIVRGRGYLTSLDEIRRIPVIVRDKGDIVRVGDIATVQTGPAARSGIGELDGEGEAVGGIVITRIGENANAVIARVKAKLEKLKSSLPEGVEIVTVYDRSDLIQRAIGNLQGILVEEMLIVALLIALFLWHARSSFVAVVSLPAAVIIAFLPMLWAKYTANIMSLGGIALAIGTMVDSAIIMTENAVKHLEGKDTAQMPEASRREVIIQAMIEMGRPLFFALLVITISFLPVFALEGREGRLFAPLAFTKTACMAVAAILAITLVPALGVLFLRGRFREESEHPISRKLHEWYEPVVDWSVRHRKHVVLGMIAAIVLTIPVALRLPTEFMPPLQEGSILYMPTAFPGMSPDTAAELLQKQDRLIRQTPEVKHVYGKAGRANTSTDPAPLNMFETIIMLKPKGEWRHGMTFEKIISELDQRLDFPGMPNIWWMPIQTRIEMLSTGIRSSIGIKVLGSDPAQTEKVAVDIEAALQGLKGATSVFAERAQQGSFVDISVKRDLASLYGLNVADVHTAIEVALAGNITTTLVEGRERYGVRVRYARDYREDLARIPDLIVPTPSGGSVRLGDIASIAPVSGPAMITTENGRVLSLVFLNTRDDSDMDGLVAEAQRRIQAKVKIPAGVEYVFAGQFESWTRARERLLSILPLVLIAIALLLYANTRCWIETGIVMLAVPGSLVGAFWLLWILGYKFSIAVGVGLLALAGLDAETGVVMLLYLTQAWERRTPSTTLEQVIHQGAVQRIRPKLMTVAAALLGLLPVMWSNGAGAEVMKRMAAPMIGGIITSGLVELIAYPAIFAIWKSKK